MSAERAGPRPQVPEMAAAMADQKRGERSSARDMIANMRSSSGSAEMASGRTVAGATSRNATSASSSAGSIAGRSA
ncbi:MAG: hypothetical protein KF773_20970 [Deltaproteobacteria bacterium]|nr:hypothetical protein [Deltaproteobacteria bacterium]